MKQTSLFLLFMTLVFSVWVQPSYAVKSIKPDKLNLEINQLLDFIQTSSCTFVRNGKQYSSKDALKHIKKKYHYYEDDINTTEKFIELSATKSSMSGKKYQIICAQEEAITSQNWLLHKLAEIRANQ